MSTYLELVNRVLENLRWNPVTSAGFTNPRDPVPAVKRFVNQAKDEVLLRMGTSLIEQDLSFETNRALTYTNSGSITIGVGSLSETTLVSADPLFSSAWMVGAKFRAPSISYNQTALPTGAGDTDPTWRRITAVTSTQIATIDYEYSSAPTNSTDWTIWRDEYDLDTSVRQVLSMWTNAGPLEICFVSNIEEFERFHIGSVTLGTPREVAILRSQTDGYFWKAKFYPAPDEREIIRYRAKVRLANLSSHGDDWNLEPELEDIIVDAATMRALKTPIQNDPDLALVLDQDVNRRIADYRDEMTPADPNRRLRRAEPGRLSDVRNLRTRIIRIDGTTP